MQATNTCMLALLLSHAGGARNRRASWQVTPMPSHPDAECSSIASHSATKSSEKEQQKLLLASLSLSMKHTQAIIINRCCGKCIDQTNKNPENKMKRSLRPLSCIDCVKMEQRHTYIYQEIETKPNNTQRIVSRQQDRIKKRCSKQASLHRC